MSDEKDAGGRNLISGLTVVQLGAIAGGLLWIANAAMDYFTTYSGTLLKNMLFPSLNEAVERTAMVAVLTALGAHMQRVSRRNKQTERMLAASRNFYLTLFDEFPALIWRSGIDAKCNYFNKAWLEFTGRPLEKEIGDGWTKGIHPEDLDKRVKAYLQAFKGRQPFTIEYRLRFNNGSYRWVLEHGSPFYNLDGKFEGYIGSCYDITERKEQERRLAYLATHDPLTRLPNRRSLEDKLKRTIMATKRQATNVLLFLDADGFKRVNDELGHATGDEVLVKLAWLLKKQLRSSDVLARLGGDEFAVLLEDTTPEEAHAVAERMLRAVEEYRFELEGRRFDLGFSIGLAVFSWKDEASKVLSNADIAMYKAKAQGGNRIVGHRPVAPSADRSSRGIARGI